MLKRCTLNFVAPSIKNAFHALVLGSLATVASSQAHAQESDTLEFVTELVTEAGVTVGDPVFTGSGVLVVQDDSGTRTVAEYRLDENGALAPTGRALGTPKLPSGSIQGMGRLVLSDDWLVVGSDSGQVIFYRRVGDWFELDDIWTPSGGSGLTVAADLTDEWLAVLTSNPSQTVLFRKGPKGWTEHSIIDQSFWYGSFSGEELLLSRSDGPGHAKIFQFDGNDWQFSYELPSTGIRYGQDSSLDGNLAAVADRDYNGSQGAVFVYERDAPGANWNTVAQFGPQVSPTSNQETAIRVIRNGRVFCAQAGNCEQPLGDRAVGFVVSKSEGGWGVEKILAPTDNGRERFGADINESAGVFRDGSAVISAFSEDEQPGCGPDVFRTVVAIWSEWRDCNEDGIWDITQILAGSHPDLDLDGVLDCCVTDDCPRTPDVNGDGCVDSKDLAMLLDAWGINSGPTDLNRDDRVDAMDLTYVLAAWERCE